MGVCLFGVVPSERFSDGMVHRKGGQCLRKQFIRGSTAAQAREPAASPIKRSDRWDIHPLSQWCVWRKSCRKPRLWETSPPPTRNMAIVPAMANPRINQGIKEISVRPVWRRRFCGRFISSMPKSSSLTITATRPYTKTVMPMPIAAITSERVSSPYCPTVPSAIMMISAERMKSVRIAPLIFSCSSPPATVSASRCTLRWRNLCSSFSTPSKHR